MHASLIKKFQPSESTGGPTAESRGSLNLNIQYWTSRGWAFVDVNYGGSTGLYYSYIIFVNEDCLETSCFQCPILSVSAYNVGLL